MKLTPNYNQIFAWLAIVAIFSTVAIESVIANDIDQITNVVYSGENTGGVSQNGQAGEDGQAGKDGEDGKPGMNGTPGTSGSSVYNTNNRSSASLKIESEIDGVKVLDIQKTQTSQDDSSLVFAKQTATSTEVEVKANLQNISSNESSSNLFSTLSETLFSLQLMLITYVSLLF